MTARRRFSKCLKRATSLLSQKRRMTLQKPMPPQLHPINKLIVKVWMFNSRLGIAKSQLLLISIRVIQRKIS